MPNVSAERRTAPRYPMVFSAEVVELPRGARLNARTADISRTGCYIDTLNPVPETVRIRLRITHNDETFEAIGRVVYVSSGLGMGIEFLEVEPHQRERLERWFGEVGMEF